MPQWGTTDPEQNEPVSNRIFAPFTQEQVENLNRFQGSGLMHPFTCPDHSDSSLLAYEHGWMCLRDDIEGAPHGCRYVQNWAHAFMADPQTLDGLRESVSELFGALRTRSAAIEQAGKDKDEDKDEHES